MQVINPATEKLICELEDDSEASVQAKFQRAKVAQKSWAAKSLDERGAILKKFGELLRGERDQLAATLTAEMGKPLAQARGEIGGVLPRLEFFLEQTETLLNPETMLESSSGSLREVVTYEPLGVVGNISAWNYPYFVGANVFLPALLTGNAVLYKPSEFATMSGQAMGRLLHEAGVDDDVFQVLTGAAQIGRALLNLPLDGMYFTGSVPTGRIVAESTAGKMMRLQLELGGKDPMYICDDVDIAAAAVAAAEGAFYNAGQSCCAVERVYVHADIYDDFVAPFLEAVTQFKVGDPTEADTFIGPLTRREQLKVLEIQVQDAISKGGRVVCGGHPREGEGYYFEPTVVLDASADMTLMIEESFGPVIGVQKVSGDAEAVALMNDTQFGLTASVYTKNEERAAAVMRQLEAGTVYWNCCDRVSPRLPWTGWKQSGVGSTLGLDGIRAFLQPKAWHFKRPG